MFIIMNITNFMNFIINNIDLIKSVSLMYIIPQIIYYVYLYNESVRKHIQENKNMHSLIKEIHQNVIKT
jgi:hypothetical protein